MTSISFLQFQSSFWFSKQFDPSRQVYHQCIDIELHFQMALVHTGMMMRTSWFLWKERMRERMRERTRRVREEVNWSSSSRSSCLFLKNLFSASSHPSYFNLETFSYRIIYNIYNRGTVDQEFFSSRIIGKRCNWVRLSFRLRFNWNDFFQSDLVLIKSLIKSCSVKKCKEEHLFDLFIIMWRRSAPSRSN